MLRGEGNATRGELGAALAVAIFTLVVIGGLVAASFPGGLLEQQSGGNTLYIVQAAEAAEAGLGNAVVALPAGTLRSLVSAGASLNLDPWVPAAGLQVEREVTRLTDTLFLIRSRGTRINADGTPLASRTLGLLVRLVSDSLAETLVRVSRRAWLQLY